jgi:hypothetical protein
MDDNINEIIWLDDKVTLSLTSIVILCLDDNIDVTSCWMIT